MGSNMELSNAKDSGCLNAFPWDSTCLHHPHIHQTSSSHFIYRKHLHKTDSSFDQWNFALQPKQALHLNFHFGPSELGQSSVQVRVVDWGFVTITCYNTSLSWRIPGFHGPLSLHGPLNYIISVIFTTLGLPKVAQLVNSEPVVFKLFSRNSILFFSKGNCTLVKDLKCLIRINS